MTRKHGAPTALTIGAVILRALPACSADCPTLQECDIRDRHCQHRTAEVAACLRGGESAAAEVDVVDASTFIDTQVKTAAENPDITEADLLRGIALLGLARSEP